MGTRQAIAPAFYLTQIDTTQHSKVRKIWGAIAHGLTAFLRQLVEQAVRSHFPARVTIPYGIAALHANALSGTQGLYFSTHVTIEESTIYPTAEQAITCLIVCQMLSNLYRDIQVFRFDDKTGEVFILASDELQIIVPRDEPWRFVDEAEL